MPATLIINGHLDSAPHVTFALMNTVFGSHSGSSDCLGNKCIRIALANLIKMGLAGSTLSSHARLLCGPRAAKNYGGAIHASSSSPVTVTEQSTPSVYAISTAVLYGIFGLFLMCNPSGE
eukprot:789009-Prymnesium_polylepis.1